MYVCKDCKKTFKEKVEYCDCGNNVFEEVADPAPPAEPINESKEELPIAPHPILPARLLSVSIFILCCTFSLCFILFFGPEPKKKEAAPITNQKTVVKDIPNIDSFWDDTPAYGMQPDYNADINTYKNGLKNALLAQLDTSTIEGSGSCDIQFTIDKHGNLKKKKLYQNTANKPLINETKKMLSSVKRYNPPPKSYDGSPLTLEVLENTDGTYTLVYKE